MVDGNAHVVMQNNESITTLAQLEAASNNDLHISRAGFNFGPVLADAVREFGVTRVANHLRVSTATVKRWIADPVDVGHVTRYGVVYMLTWLRSSVQQSEFPFTVKR